MVWSLALWPDDAKQDPVVCDADFSVRSVPGERRRRVQNNKATKGPN